MEKEFIPYEQALALKELRFDEPCLGWMRDWAKDVCLGKHEPSHHHASSCNAILYQQAFRWFREKYSLDYSIKPVYGEKHYKKHRCNVYSNEQLSPVMKYYFPDNPYFDSREEAELECLKKLIEIVKN